MNTTRRILFGFAVVVSSFCVTVFLSAQEMGTLQTEQGVVRRLIQQLQDPVETTRLQAAKQLGTLGAAARDAVPELRKATQDSDIDVRQMAAAALARILGEQVVVPGRRPDLFMLAVGIDRYQAPVNNLSGCVNDALGMANVFKAQKGKLYGTVETQILADADATRANIHAGLESLRTKGKPGDWYVIVLSGHGGPAMQHWAFLTHDRGDLTDDTILGVADSLASDGKKVLVLIDACFVGQIRYAANAILNRHRDPNKGGIILAISSMPAQTSSALGNYSAFARAFEEGMAGMADLDGNKIVTLMELRRFTYNRVYELVLQRRFFPGLPVATQDSVIDASLSMAESMPLAYAQNPPPIFNDDGIARSMPSLHGTWERSENTGHGVTTYRLKLDPNGHFRATMTVGDRSTQVGEGIFRAMEKALQLQHWQGVDRLENATVVGEELRFRFQGHALALKRYVPPAPVAGGVAGTTWIGTESLKGFGALTMQFEPDGKAIMIDAKSTVNGQWTQVGHRVTITFQNCVYVGDVMGQTLSGNANYTNGEGAWTFSLTQRKAPSRIGSTGS